MKNKRFLITEEERNDILSMYGLLKEDEPTGARQEITIQGQTFFDNGKWKSISQQGLNEINPQLENAARFLIANKGSVVYIKITAGESQVTNYDTEVSPKVQVGQGYLSQKRAETMKQYLSKYFETLITNKNIDKMPIFEAPEIVIGQTEYKGPQDLNDPTKSQQYSTERFVKVELKIQAPAECIVGLTIEVYYDPKQLCGKRHICDAALFDVYLNQTKIGIANLNNKKDGGARTSGPLQVSNELAKQVIGETPRNIEIITVCQNKEGDCHSSTPRVKVSKGSTVLYDGCTPEIRADRGEHGPKVILVLDPCGNPILKGTEKANAGDEEPNAAGQTTSGTTSGTTGSIKQIKYYSTTGTGTLDGYINYLIEKKKVIKNNDGSLKALMPIDFYFNKQSTRVKKDEIFKLI
jgi:hypothetical protein